MATADHEPDETPPYGATFNQNVSEVLRLVNIHEKITGTGPGRRNQVEVLNKSAIVLLVACWEAYVEDLASLAFDFLLANANVCDVFPNRVLTVAANEIRASHDHRRVWELAGDGWRNVLLAHKKAVLAEYVGTFNTPKPEQIDNLFEQLLGLKSLSNSWIWPKTTSDNARKRLKQLVELRGDIAHRVKTSRGVTKAQVVRAAELIDRLATATSNIVREHLHARTNKYPWPRAWYRPPEWRDV